jgi:hypothetical protein
MGSDSRLAQPEGPKRHKPFYFSKIETVLALLAKACLRVLDVLSSASVSFRYALPGLSRLHLTWFLRTFGAGDEPQERVSRRKQGR